MFFQRGLSKTTNIKQNKPGINYLYERITGGEIYLVQQATIETIKLDSSYWIV